MKKHLRPLFFAAVFPACAHHDPQIKDARVQPLPPVIEAKEEVRESGYLSDKGEICYPATRFESSGNPKFSICTGKAIQMKAIYKFD